jgi:hypothetical protein
VPLLVLAILNAQACDKNCNLLRLLSLLTEVGSWTWSFELLFIFTGYGGIIFTGCYGIMDMCEQLTNSELTYSHFQRPLQQLLLSSGQSSSQAEKLVMVT